MDNAVFEKCLKIFQDSPHLKTCAAGIRARDGITYADLWELLCEIMDQD